MTDIVQRIARWRDSGVGMVMDLLPDAQVELIRLRAERAAAEAQSAIDDRAIAFNGDWNAAELQADAIRSFKPWMQQAKAVRQ